MYQAPEVIAGKEYGFKADVWSLGVILCALLTGVFPFTAPTEALLAGMMRRGVSPWGDQSGPLSRQLSKTWLPAVSTWTPHAASPSTKSRITPGWPPCARQGLTPKPPGLAPAGAPESQGPALPPTGALGRSNTKGP